MKKNKFGVYGIFLLVFSLLAVISCGGPSTYYVDESYKGTEKGTGSQPYRTITAAMKKAASGDRIDVAPGLYRENISMKKGVKLISKKIGAAIIHGGADRIGGNPTVIGADKALLQGFTIAGGYDGILCKGTSPVIKRNIIRSNYGDGGIICLNGSQADIQNNTVLGNLGNSKKGPSIGLYAEKATPTIKNNIITGNSIGYAPYLCSPKESYNNIWGNRSNFGYSASAGTGTISKDPLFQYVLNNTENKLNDNDFRLSTNSPCRNAGDPNPACKDSDGTRNDMGAFDGNGGYSVSLPAQEYFIESILRAVDAKNGLQLNGTSRFTSNPVFWFKGVSSTQDIQRMNEARRLITDAVRVLTNSLCKADYWDKPQAPTDLCSIITVTFDTPRGATFRKGVNSKCQDPGGKLQKKGASIIGGELHLDSDFKPGFSSNPRQARTLLHELGHVAGLFHAYRGDRVIAYGSGYDLKDYSPIEKEAFTLLYTLPIGTTLEDLIKKDKITRNALYPFPQIDQLYIWKQTTGWPWFKTTQAKVGDILLLEGSRLTLRCCNEKECTGDKPPGYSPPKVYFENIVVTADMQNQASVQGGPSRFIKVKVPKNAHSGWVYVQVRGLESNPVYLEIKTK